MSTPLVTVIINCFNGEAYLRQAIDSVIAQTWTRWEIVFWDNQSSDDSANLVKSYNDPRIRYFYAPSHTLLYEARNNAIQKARGSLLAFLDVDDYWLPTKLELQVALFSDEDVSLVYGNYWIGHERKKKQWIAYRNRLPAGYILDALLETYKVGLLTVIVRKNHLPNLKNPFDSRFNIIGDFDLVIRLAAEKKIACVQEPIALYRIHEENLSSLQPHRHLAELQCWISEKSRHKLIKESKNFSRVTESALYKKATLMLLEGNRKGAFRVLSLMQWSALKIRLFCMSILPRFMLYRLKN